MNLDDVQDWTAFAARHDFRVKAIAQHFKVNRRRLYRKIRAKFQRASPRAWLAQLREALAVELLRAGKLSIKEIAERLRFSAASAFTRAFKRWQGMSPRQFRRRWRAGRPVPALPGTWAECNGQAVVDADSPLHGQTLPDLNGAQGGVPCFLRGANASGGTGGNETHTHAVDLTVNGGSVQQGADFVVMPPGVYNTDPASILPTYYAVVWVVRVK